MKKVNIMWFRSDLRVQDNTALYQASLSNYPVVALYIVTPEQWEEHSLAPIQADLIARRLAWLQQQLQTLAIPLLMLQVNSFSDIPALFHRLIQQLPIAQVYANKQYAYNESRRDDKVLQLLTQYNVQLLRYDDNCILPPGTVTTASQSMFQVYSPFRNAWLQIYLQRNINPFPIPTLSQQHQLADRSALLMLAAESMPFSYPRKLSQHWPVTDTHIDLQLKLFCTERVKAYALQRDNPVLVDTSSLSPYLAIGAISARQCLAALTTYQGAFWEDERSGAFAWWNELVWREFYQHLTVAHPRLSKNQPFQPWAVNLRWSTNEAHLAAWQQGKTGFPIIDAAMRQLQRTGWIHNRLRMLVASFLTKELQLDWRHGELWFMNNLIDGDFINNNGGWQLSASTGVDAQPYFRIFNPTIQSKKYDADGVFIRQWLPELDTVPNKYIHQPEIWSESDTLDYPVPIIDRKMAIQQTLVRFEQAKSSS